MSRYQGRSGAPSDGLGSPLSETSRRRRTYRMVNGLGTSAAQIKAAGASTGRFDRAGESDAAEREDDTLDAAFRAAAESYGEHGGGPSASASATWPGRPAVAWSQPAGDPFDAERTENEGERAEGDENPAWDSAFASPKGFPHTPEIGAFSALTSRRLHGRTPKPVVTRPMAFRPDVMPAPLAPPVPTMASAPRPVPAPRPALAQSPAMVPMPPMAPVPTRAPMPPVAESAGLVEVPAPEHEPRLPQVKESTRIFILSGQVPEGLTAPIAGAGSTPPTSPATRAEEAPAVEAQRAEEIPPAPRAAEAPVVASVEAEPGPEAAPAETVAIEPEPERVKPEPPQPILLPEAIQTPDPVTVTPLAALPASVLTSPSQFTHSQFPKQDRPVVTPGRERHWGFLSLVFGLSTAATVVVGVLVLSPHRETPRWLASEPAPSVAAQAAAPAPERPVQTPAIVTEPKRMAAVAPAVAPEPAPPPAVASAPEPAPAPPAPAPQAVTPEAPPAPAAEVFVPEAPPVQPSEDLALRNASVVAEPLTAAQPAETSHSAPSLPTLLGAAPPASAPEPKVHAKPASTPVAREETRAMASVAPRPRVTTPRAPVEPRREVLRPRPRPSQPKIRTADLDALTGQAEFLLSAGKVEEARAAFRQAAAKGDPRGARGVARTYDEDILRRFTGTGPAPDPEKSKLWYQIANSLEERRTSRTAPSPTEVR